MELFREKYLHALNLYADKIAYRDPLRDTEYTYRAFDVYVRKLAAKLAKNGVGRADTCVIALPHSLDFIAVMYACILSGICYVPLSEHYPHERINIIAKDSEAKIVIREDFLADVDEMTPVSDFPKLSADTLALRVYTSGSTGKPKGVMHDQESLINSIRRGHIAQDFSENDIYGGNSPFYFIVHISDAISPFFCGVTNVLIPEEYRVNPNELSKFIDKEGITNTFISPKVLKFFKKTGDSLKRVITGSEKVKNIFPSDFQVVCGWGMSETASGAMSS